MDDKYYYYAVSNLEAHVLRDGVMYKYNRVIEVPCDYDTAKNKAEKQRKLINMINDLRRK